MSLNRYYGTLMYCTFLPFSIYALDEKEALAQLQKNAPELLNESEKKEISLHLTRIPQADRVILIRKETANEQNANQASSPFKSDRVLPKIRRSRPVKEPVSHSQGA